MKKFHYIDIHTHLNLPEFDHDRDEVITRLYGQSIGAINVGVDSATSRFAVELAEQHDHLWAIVGHHPAYVDDEEFKEEVYRELLTHTQVVGVGECGLDYFRIEKTPEHLAKQEDLFRRQIELAIEYDKPLMLHIRPTRDTHDAYDDALELLAEYKKEAGDRLRGDAHFFAGTLEHAQKFIALGFSISFTGVITFARDYDNIIKNIPLDRIMCETDAPYVAPTPYRGQRNSPEYVGEVYKKLAEIRNQDNIREQILENVRRLWGINIE
ncbi:TatD family hydrolase [Candidatus Nomurabacteria bacterium]|nr:TatD family hydrolase [Candidatus Nomurabacteria bacterium]